MVPADVVPPPERAWHTLDRAEVEASLGTSGHGLGRDEVRARLDRWGPNQLEEAPPPSRLAILLHQFTSPLISILVAATLITLALREFVDTGVIAAVLVLNAIIGFVQEYRAELSVRALMRLVAPRARVVREGREWEVESRDLVLLESGARVPADLRVISVTALLADESLLTGESVPVRKSSARLETAELAGRARVCMRRSCQICSRNPVSRQKLTKGLGGPQKLTVLLARLSGGKTGVNIRLEDIEKAWSRMRGLVGGKFYPMYATRAKDNGWVDTPRTGYSALRAGWAEALGEWMVTPSVTVELERMLQPAFPAKHVKAALKHFQTMAGEFRQGAWEEAIAKGGKFVEAALNALYVHVGRSLPAAREFKAGRVMDDLERLPSGPSDDSIRLTIPRACRFMYDIASNRGARHDPAEVDPNEMDARAVVAGASWVLAEMLRYAQRGALDPARVQALVEGLTQRQYPLIEDVDGRVYFHVPGASARDVALLSLWHRARRTPCAYPAPEPPGAVSLTARHRA